MLKRTRHQSQGINQFAADVVRRSTEQAGPVDNKAAISQVIAAMGRKGGLE